jgi:hypothetical protein
MKTLLWASGLILAIAAVGCTKKNYYTNPGKTVLVSVDSTDWAVDAAAKAWVVSINMPEIDDNVAANDGVVVAISYDQGGQFESIPELYNGYSYSYTYQSGSPYGNVSIYAQAPGGTPTAVSPGSVVVKIVILPSNQ